MQFGLPRVSANSLKGFLGQYLMIVLSVLTALALDAWVQHAQHAQAAAEAGSQIKAELRANLEDILRTRAHDARRLKALEQLRGSVLRDMKAGLPDTVIEQHIVARSGDFWFGLNTVDPRHEAWDVAVANQSIGWIDKASLQRYATLYARLNEYRSKSALNLRVNMQGLRPNDLALALEIGKVQPQRFMQGLNGMTTALHDAVVMLDGLQQDYRKDMPVLFASVQEKPR